MDKMDENTKTEIHCRFKDILPGQFFLLNLSYRDGHGIDYSDWFERTHALWNKMDWTTGYHFRMCKTEQFEPEQSIRVVRT